MAQQWDGSNWTAGHWDASNFRGPNEADSGIRNISATLTGSGEVSADATAAGVVAPPVTSRPGGVAQRSRKRKLPPAQIAYMTAGIGGSGGLSAEAVWIDGLAELLLLAA